MTAANAMVDEAITEPWGHGAIGRNSPNQGCPCSQWIYPPPPCISYALVRATAGVGTVLIWYLI